MNNKDKYLSYLNELSDWGVVNMQDSAPYLLQRFPELSLEEARIILTEYTATKFQLLNESPYGT